MAYESGIFYCVLLSLIIQLIFLILYLVKDKHECDCKVTSTFANSRYTRYPPIKYLTKDQLQELWKNTGCPKELTDSDLNWYSSQSDRYFYDLLARVSRNKTIVQCGASANFINYTNDQINELKQIWFNETGQSDLSYEVKEAIVSSQQSRVPYENFKKNKFMQLIETENFRNKGFY